jgi:hypothetical protein
VSTPVAGGGDYRDVVVDRDGPAGRLVFDRPGVGNAMDAAMLGDLPKAWRDLDEDPAAWAGKREPNWVAPTAEGTRR